MVRLSTAFVFATLAITPLLAAPSVESTAQDLAVREPEPEPRFGGRMGGRMGGRRGGRRGFRKHAAAAASGGEEARELSEIEDVEAREPEPRGGRMGGRMGGRRFGGRRGGRRGGFRKHAAAAAAPSGGEEARELSDLEDVEAREPEPRGLRMGGRMGGRRFGGRRGGRHGGFRKHAAAAAAPSGGEEARELTDLEDVEAREPEPRGGRMGGRLGGRRFGGRRGGKRGGFRKHAAAAAAPSGGEEARELSDLEEVEAREPRYGGRMGGRGGRRGGRRGGFRKHAAAAASGGEEARELAEDIDAREPRGGSGGGHWHHRREIESVYDALD